MEKLCYLIRQARAHPGARLREALIEKAAPRLRAGGALHVQVNVNDEAVAQGEGVRLAKLDPPIRGMVSFWMEDADLRAGCEAALRDGALALHGYLVVESVPIPNRRHRVPHGQRTPGVNMTTGITKRADLSYEQFVEIWHGHHRRVAIETQSTFGYVRNEIVRALTPGAPAFEAIVEENFPIEALTDPWVWYDCASEEDYKRRLDRMMDSSRRFLDLAGIESHAMSEYVLG
jgi:hypothetical protein